MSAAAIAPIIRDLDYLMLIDDTDLKCLVNLSHELPEQQWEDLSERLEEIVIRQRTGWTELGESYSEVNAVLSEAQAKYLLSGQREWLDRLFPDREAYREDIKEQTDA